MAVPGEALRFDDPDLHFDDPRLRYGMPFPADPNTNMENRISTVLAAQAVTNIQAAIATARTNLPFLVTLTSEERKTMAKGGSKSQGIIQLSLDFAAQNTTALPGDFNTVEYAKDGALHDQLEAISLAIAQLNEDVNDTLMVLNSELYLQSVAVYAFAKVNNRNGQYDSYINLLKPFFARPRHTPATPPPGP
jgi:hypothetical protein